MGSVTLFRGRVARDTVCYPNRYFFVFDQLTDIDADDLYDSTPACSGDLGSYEPCLTDGSCAPGEFCRPFVNRTSTLFEPRCVRSFGPDGDFSPGPCEQHSDCDTGYCVNLRGRPEKVCRTLCLAESDCPGGMSCISVSFLLYDRGNDDPEDDIRDTVNVCYPIGM